MRIIRYIVSFIAALAIFMLCIYVFADNSQRIQDLQNDIQRLQQMGLVQDRANENRDPVLHLIREEVIRKTAMILELQRQDELEKEKKEKEEADEKEDSASTDVPDDEWMPDGKDTVLPEGGVGAAGDSPPPHNESLQSGTETLGNGGGNSSQ